MSNDKPYQNAVLGHRERRTEDQKHPFEQMPNVSVACRWCGHGVAFYLHSNVPVTQPAPDAGLREWRVVKTQPERHISDVELHGCDEPLRLPWHRRGLLEQIVADHNAVPKLVRALRLVHACGTLRDDGTCDGCPVSNALATTGARQ